jgi:CheY-like chemotaxis protein
MSDDFSEFMARREPTGDRPLLGLTVLVVEDSRFASEAMRLLCLHSGARIRRADCLRSARKHLQCYRPTVVIVDLGLPDGSGIDLIRDLATMSPRIPVLLGTSGDALAEQTVLAAGADGFLAKPIESLAAFQQKVLGSLPASTRPVLRGVPRDDQIMPDPIALRDDLCHVADILGNKPDAATLGYIAQFLTGVARSAHDAPLQAAAEALAREQHAGHGLARPLSQINGLVQERLAAQAQI